MSGCVPSSCLRTLVKHTNSIWSLELLVFVSVVLIIYLPCSGKAKYGQNGNKSIVLNTTPSMNWKVPWSWLCNCLGILDLLGCSQIKIFLWHLAFFFLNEIMNMWVTVKSENQPVQGHTAKSCQTWFKFRLWHYKFKVLSLKL